VNIFASHKQENNKDLPILLFSFRELPHNFSSLYHTLQTDTHYFSLLNQNQNHNYFFTFFILPFSIYITQAHTKSEGRGALGSKCYVWLNVSPLLIFQVFDSRFENNINIPISLFPNRKIKNLHFFENKIIF